MTKKRENTKTGKNWRKAITKSDYQSITQNIILKFIVWCHGHQTTERNTLNDVKKGL